MAGCIPCFVIPLLLFIFHRYLQPILLKIWNPWEKLEQKDVKFSCPCDANGTCAKPDTKSKNNEENIPVQAAGDGKTEKVE